MSITSFEDIRAIDSKLASLFLRPDEAVNWINAINGGIKEWIEKNNKQYWDVVRFVTLQRGILGVFKRDKKSVRLTRKNFARILLKFCSEAVSEHEKINALKASMEHYPYADQFRNIEKTLECHLVRQHIKEVEALFDNGQIIEKTEVSRNGMSVLEVIMEEYLRKTIDTHTDGFPYSKLCIRPQYDNITPAISIETYQSKKFLDEEQPSQIVAYEFVSGVLQKEQLYQFIGQYSSKQTIKLFIVSPKGLLPDVRAIAYNNKIGYVRLNPKESMTSDHFELPRYIEDNSQKRHYIEMLMRRKHIDIPLLIMNDWDVTPFLADVLNAQGVSVKPPYMLSVPYISSKEIERRAESLTSNDVQRIIDKLDSSGLVAKGCSINLYSYITSQGLTCSIKKLKDESQLGKLDVEKKHITLNKARMNSPSMRFTMAHEIGHHVLHSALFKDMNIISICETNETLTSISDNSHRRLEYQANQFASFLLMPRKLVIHLYGFLFQKYIHDIYGDSYHPLYYSPKQPETWTSYNNIVGTMTKMLNVSKKAMEIRLQSLGLLIIDEQKPHLFNFLFR